ncbi:MAG: 50S ribosomal protein L30 [Deltaproteobacteria bacterium]|nr:50S ribosomal protein L30 [Deltaproteobacteria bacterium]
MEKQLKITLVKSPIGMPQNQREVLRGLGLRKMNGSVILKDAREIRGMATKVAHLVSVEEL